MSYATTTDLARFGLPAAALSGVSTATQEAAIDAAEHRKLTDEQGWLEAQIRAAG